MGTELEALKSFITSGSGLKLFDTLSDDIPERSLSNFKKIAHYKTHAKLPRLQLTFDFLLLCPFS